MFATTHRFQILLVFILFSYIIVFIFTYRFYCTGESCPYLSVVSAVYLFDGLDYGLRPAYSGVRLRHHNGSTCRHLKFHLEIAGRLGEHHARTRVNEILLRR